jgi:uncharacterized membrane protein
MPLFKSKIPMTDSEKLDNIQKHVKIIEIIHAVGVIFVIMGFIGIVSAHDLVSKIKNKIH